jgi:hypothetical protein
LSPSATTLYRELVQKWKSRLKQIDPMQHYPIVALARIYENPRGNTMTMFYRPPLSLRLALTALLAATCVAQTTPVSWNVASKRIDLFIKADSVVKPGPQSILLIGENHASVKTQTQLADLLEALYRGQAIDAILVEGSNGSISASELRRSLANVGQKSIAPFWRGQLDFGQIAGYEYVALTRDGVRIYGVEDMDAKRRYMADAGRRGVESGLREQIDLHTRAIGIAKDALAGAGPSASQRSDTDAVLSSYEAKVTEFRNLVTRNGAEYASAASDYTDAIERTTALYSRVQSILPAYDQVAKLAVPYNKLVEIAKKVSAGESLPPGTDPTKFLSDLQAAKSRLEKASAAFEVVSKKAGYLDDNAVVTDLKQISEIQARLKSTEERISKLGGAFGKLESAMSNQFFLAANAVRTAVGRPVPALQNLLREEREKARTNANDQEKPYLSDRDKYMVANTLAYLRANPTVRNVALIIGYAHLEGMTKRLSAENVAVLGGKIAASEEETEAWENRAWERRSRPAVQIFSQHSRKEISRLLDETYKTEIPALLAKLETVTANPSAGIALGKTKIFETSTGAAGRKAIVTTGPENLRANWGSHVVQMGAVPDGRGTAYLIVDRDIARDQVKALSDSDTAFATMYRTKGTQGLRTKLDTSTGTVDFLDFKARAPRSGKRPPKRMVIVPEGDEKVLNTALGSGGSGGEPPWTSRRALFAEPPDDDRPSIFFTKNMLVASERLKAIEKQDPLKIGAIATIEIGFNDGKARPSLNDLWFTPETGEHARAYFIVGDNTPEFRARLKEAADAGLLRNKQIALGTCFDENESNAINDMLLEAGALMVWSPGKRISPEAARKLASYMERIDTASLPPVRGLDDYIDRTLQLWHTETKTDAKADPDIDQFLDSTNWVKLQLSSEEVIRAAD